MRDPEGRPRDAARLAEEIRAIQDGLTTSTPARGRPVVASRIDQRVLRGAGPLYLALLPLEVDSSDSAATQLARSMESALVRGLPSLGLLHTLLPAPREADEAIRTYAERC